MVSKNKKVHGKYAKKTYEGGPAYPHMTQMQALRRSVCACFLWENEFYEDGETIASRIHKLASEVPPADLSALAVEVRSVMHLRHVPLQLLVTLIKTGAGIPHLVANTIAAVIQRPDEISELLALYWKANKGDVADNAPLSGQLKKGLARALNKFDAFALAKYNAKKEVRLRDALFLSHAKPNDDEAKATFAKLATDTLETPDTWEVNLSGGKDKKETFERLLSEKKLGYLALLRNLRNMTEAGVDTSLITDAIIARRGSARVLPFRYVAAARAVPSLELFIDQALCAAIKELPALKGKTFVLVDVSSSMTNKLSAKSDLKRIDAAAALASIINGDLRVFSFSNSIIEVPPRRGMAGVDALIRSQPHMGTYLGGALTELNKYPHDRLIVITDEQTTDHVPNPVCDKAYMINVASATNGVGYGKWKHIDGFSENVIRWIIETEKLDEAYQD